MQSMNDYEQTLYKFYKEPKVSGICGGYVTNPNTVFSRFTPVYNNYVNKDEIIVDIVEKLIAAENADIEKCAAKTPEEYIRDTIENYRKMLVKFEAGKISIVTADINK